MSGVSSTSSTRGTGDGSARLDVAAPRVELAELGALVQRQPDPEGRASPAPGRFGRDPAAVQLDQALHQRQADAQAALVAGGRRIRLAEQLEHVRQERRRDAAAGVADLEQRLARRRATGAR